MISGRREVGDFEDEIVRVDAISDAGSVADSDDNRAPSSSPQINQKLFVSYNGVKDIVNKTPQDAMVLRGDDIDNDHDADDANKKKIFCAIIPRADNEGSTNIFVPKSLVERFMGDDGYLESIREYKARNIRLNTDPLSELSKTILTGSVPAYFNTIEGKMDSYVKIDANKETKSFDIEVGSIFNEELKFIYIPVKDDIDQENGKIIYRRFEVVQEKDGDKVADVKPAGFATYDKAKNKLSVITRDNDLSQHQSVSQEVASLPDNVRFNFTIRQDSNDQLVSNQMVKISFDNKNINESKTQKDTQQKVLHIIPKPIDFDNNVEKNFLKVGDHNINFVFKEEVVDKDGSQKTICKLELQEGDAEKIKKSKGSMLGGGKEDIFVNRNKIDTKQKQGLSFMIKKDDVIYRAELDFATGELNSIANKIEKTQEVPLRLADSHRGSADYSR